MNLPSFPCGVMCVLVCARVGAEVCVCAHVCMKSEICISALVCMPTCVCVVSVVADSGGVVSRRIR